MNPLRLLVVVSFVGLMASVQGCADSSEAETTAVEEGALERRVTQASDDAIKAKLGELLRDVTFMSESDYPYTVIEAPAPAQRVRRLTTKSLRTHLATVVKENTSSNRDISRTQVRADKLTLADTIADASLTDPDERDAKQAGLAVKYMTEQLRGVVGYTFGTNASGDQDEEGPVVYVYVGVSKTTGKLIGIITEAVYT